ncbi:hypothetical protein NMB32_06070 [Stenotrophomonas sp. CD2]|nr:hypothetical protein NMB32_06070 [Stenotrophomonas sp. CD2]
MALTVALLAACGQAPAPDAAPAAPAPATEAPAATATVVEKAPSIEDGVDPSVWDNEGEPEDPSAGGELTCADNPLATHFFTLVGGNTVDDCGRKDPKVLAAFNALMKNTAAAESADKEIPSLRERLLSGPSGLANWWCCRASRGGSIPPARPTTAPVPRWRCCIRPISRRWSAVLPRAAVCGGWANRRRNNVSRSDNAGHCRMPR